MFQTVDINIVPTGDMPVVNVSQYDTNRVIRFNLLNDGEAYRPTNLIKCEFIIRKVDGTLFTQETTIMVSNVVEMFTTEQMTACAGKNIGEIRLTFNDPDIAEDNVIISTLNFILDVERSPEVGGIESESEIANLNGQIAAIVDEQLDNYYTKTEIDTQIETIVSEQVTPIVADIVAEQVPPAVQAELDNYYTKDDVDTYFYNKTETDILLSGKADTSDLPDMTDYYNKSETDTLLSGKVSNSTLNDYYNKTQVDNLIAGVSTDFTTAIDTQAAVQTFSDGGNNIPMKSLEVAIVAQQASGTPSPSNPLSITGFDEVDVAVTKNNAWDETWEAGLINPTTGNNAPSTSSLRSTGYIDVTPSEKYVVSVKNYTSLGLRVLCYSSSKTFLRAIEDLCKNESISTITLQSDVYYIRFACLGYLDQNTTYKNDIRVSLGDVYTITLPETIYGGTAELVGGNGNKTFGYAIFDGSEDETWSMHPTISNVFYIDNALPNAYYDQDVAGFAISNIYEQNAYAPLSSLPNNKFAIGYPNTLRLAVKNTACADLASFKTALSSTPMQVVYKLAPPTAFTFTGANIPTLSGVNNVYADSGDVNALEYFNDKGDDIASMVRLMTRS